MSRKALLDLHWLFVVIAGKRRPQIKTPAGALGETTGGGMG
jgi:hypothetical protein